MLVVKGEDGNLRFLIHPELRKIVHKEDFPYIDDLMKDFIERAKLHPTALFKQISALEVGPLVTHEIGLSLSESPSIQKFTAKFVQL